MRAIAQLNHPNIVGAMDAGEVADIDGNVLHFFVMEYVPGQDLEEYIRAHGPLAATQACDIIHQVASALAEANKHQLVHRDIKPSNVQITPDGQAKLLDFGLARKFSSGLTEHGTLLGTLDFMAPEQVHDAHKVDIRADLYGLGGVLYWCLTGLLPFPNKDDFIRAMTSRLVQQPPAVRAVRPDVAIELEQVIQKMMALNPDDRYLTPEAVMQALLPFLKSALQSLGAGPSAIRPMQTASKIGDTVCSTQRSYNILLVDDDPIIRRFCRFLLQNEGMLCDEAESGEAALIALADKTYDLVILDVEMDDMSGMDVCLQVREMPICANLKVMMSSGNGNADTMANMLLRGADDFITKPYSSAQLQSKVKSLLRLKDAQDREEFLNHQLMTLNRQLEQALSARDSDIVDAQCPGPRACQNGRTPCQCEGLLSHAIAKVCTCFGRTGPALSSFLRLNR